MCIKPYIPDTSGCPKNIRFRCILKKNTSELHKNRQSRCIHPSKILQIYQDLSKSLKIYQFKQPALPHTKSSKRISAQIIVRPARAGICCEGEQVYSREINMNTSELSNNLRIEQCCTTNHMRLELQKYQKSS